MDPALILFIGIIIAKSSSLEHDCVLRRVSLQITALYQHLLTSLLWPTKAEALHKQKAETTANRHLTVPLETLNMYIARARPAEKAPAEHKLAPTSQRSELLPQDMISKGRNFVH